MSDFIFGAIVGDVIGSRFEFNNFKNKDFELFHKDCTFTDDSVMTLAIAEALLTSKKDFSDLSKNAVTVMKSLGSTFGPRGYGVRFSRWLQDKNSQPYNSFGNGAAMRISPVAFVGKSIDEVKFLSRTVTEVTHNHCEGLKGAEATAVAIFLLLKKTPISEVKKHICKNYYDINFTLDEIRNTYSFDETCQGSVPQAFEAFFEAKNFEDAVRNAISIGGDSDTIAAISGSLAQAAFGVPDTIAKNTFQYLKEPFFSIQTKFAKTFL